MVEEHSELLEMDVSDVDRWVGIPLGGTQPREPFSRNDIRRFVQGMANPNPLFFDQDYAGAGRWGDLVAPQSYFGGGPGTGATPSIQGNVPGSHMLFGGDEQWFYGPRVHPGVKLSMDRMLFDYRVTDTSFAGPTLFSRGDTTYVNQRGELLAKQRSTSIRYLAENARLLGSFSGAGEEDPEWTDEELEEIAAQRIEWVKSFRERGHEPHYFESVSVGDELTTRAIGPHSVQTFTSESRTETGPNSWGAFEEIELPTSVHDAGWLPEMSRDPEKIAIDPAFGDGLVYGASRGHVQPRYAQLIGMPRGYGYGATMCAWVVDYLENWGGEWGFVRHHRTQYRNPAFTGDVTYIRGQVTDVADDHPDRGTVQVEYTMKNQDDALMAKGRAEVELPKQHAELRRESD